jgi:hypothetical protein
MRFGTLGKCRDLGGGGHDQNLGWPRSGPNLRRERPGHSPGPMGETLSLTGVDITGSAAGRKRFIDGQS